MSIQLDTIFLLEYFTGMLNALGSLISNDTFFVFVCRLHLIELFQLACKMHGVWFDW